jgi:hypothetical protein
MKERVLPAGTGQSIGYARWGLVAAVTAAGLLGVVTVWVTLALLTGLACGWMALVAALDFALLLRLVLAPPGPARTAIAVLATALACVASAWLIVAGQFGAVLGLDPIASALRLGPVLAWEFTRLGFKPWDWACVAFSPLLAGLLVRPPRA